MTKKLNRDYITKDVKNIYEKHLSKFLEIKEAVDDNRSRYKTLLADSATYQPDRKRELLSMLDNEHKKLLKEVRKNEDSFLMEVEDLKEDSNYRFKDYYSLTGDINDGVYTMLKEGVLSDNEIMGLYDEFKENKSMLRLLAKYTEDRQGDDMKKFNIKCARESRTGNKINEAINSILPMATRALGVGREGLDNVSMATGFQNHIEETFSKASDALAPVSAENVGGVGSIYPKWAYSEEE